MITKKEQELFIRYGEEEEGGDEEGGGVKGETPSEQMTLIINSRSRGTP